jgi:hypothetical protein
MRTVEIIHDPKDQQPWVAIDYRTREPVLRLGDRDQLEQKQICIRFGWRIARAERRDLARALFRPARYLGAAVIDHRTSGGHQRKEPPGRAERPRR